MAITADKPASDIAVRPFKIEVSEADLADLKARVLATRWPEKETVDDLSQGTPLATVQALAQYWATGYDWRRCEARINSYPQFLAEIDGLDIHFLHIRSPHEDALPLVVCHGWPGSIVEQLKIIEPLTNPTAHGGQASDAFHVVIPSMPGYGYSGKPTANDWGPERIATCRGAADAPPRIRLRRRGGRRLGRRGRRSDGCARACEMIGIHTNFPGVVRDDVTSAVVSSSCRRRLDDEERKPVRAAQGLLGDDVTTPSRWRPTRSPCTESRTRPSAWPLDARPRLD